MHEMAAILRARLMLVARAYADAKGLKLTTLGAYAASDQHFFGQLAKGRNITAAAYDRMIAFFTENWPPEVKWPLESLILVQEGPQATKANGKGRKGGHKHADRHTEKRKQSVARRKSGAAKILVG
jgi:hypothetical protein